MPRLFTFQAYKRDKATPSAARGIKDIPRCAAARHADRLEAEEKHEEHAGGFLEWFRTVENQGETMRGLTEDIHRMLQTSEDPGEDNPLKNVRILPPRFSMSPSGIV